MGLVGLGQSRRVSREEPTGPWSSSSGKMGPGRPENLTTREARVFAAPEACARVVGPRQDTPTAFAEPGAPLRAPNTTTPGLRR